MKSIEFIKLDGLTDDKDQEGDKKVSQLFKGPFRQIVEVALKNSAVLARHKADVPITVYCVSGKGIFSAGPDLAESVDLVSGTLITLEADVEHEVIADPDINLIVSKFRAS